MLFFIFVNYYTAITYRVIWVLLLSICSIKMFNDWFEILHHLLQLSINIFSQFVPDWEEFAQIMLQVMLSQVHANPSVAAKGKYSYFFSKPHLEELPGFIPVHFMISTPSVHKNTVSYKLCSTYVKSLSLSACWSCLLPELLELTASSNGFNISSSSCCWAIIKSNSWSSLTIHLICWWLFPEFVFTCYLLAE